MSRTQAPSKNIRYGGWLVPPPRHRSVETRRPGQRLYPFLRCSYCGHRGNSHRGERCLEAGVRQSHLDCGDDRRRHRGRAAAHPVDDRSRGAIAEGQVSVGRRAESGERCPSARCGRQWGMAVSHPRSPARRDLAGMRAGSLGSLQVDRGECSRLARSTETPHLPATRPTSQGARREDERSQLPEP